MRAIAIFGMLAVAVAARAEEGRCALILSAKGAKADAVAKLLGGDQLPVPDTLPARLADGRPCAKVVAMATRLRGAGARVGVVAGEPAPKGFDYNVRLTALGKSAYDVVRVLRVYSDMDVESAKRLTQALPREVDCPLDRAAAEAMVQDLVAAGARAEVVKPK